MPKSTIKIAWRSLRKNKASSLINIGGLALGMAVAMMIGLWIWDELSYDKNHPNYDRITQVMQTVTNNGDVQTVENLPYPLAAELRKNYGQDFTYIVMGLRTGKHILTFNDKKLLKTGTYFEPQAPEMFGLKMLKGTRDGLKDPSSILISASVAKAYFGDENPMNKTMMIDNRMNVKVTGVYEDLPLNSTLADMGFIAPWDLYFQNNEWVRTAQDPWRPNAFAIYAQLTDHADLDKVSFKIRDAKLNKVNKQLAKKKPALFLHPMSKWHLYSDFKNGVNTGGRIQYVWMFGIIGSFVLLLACINFMNLSTARSEKRAREVGIRKVIGSLRGQLIGQFFTESLIVVVFAFALSILLVGLSLPFFNEVANKKLSILWDQPMFWLMGIGFILITGLVAGSYPALYLSSFQPIKVLKGAFRAGRFAAMPRKVLVVLQFTVSVTLIIGTLIVFRQIQFAKNRPIGYDRNNLVTLPMVGSAIHTHFDAVRNDLVRTGAIAGIAEAGNSTTSSGGSSSGFEWKDKDPNLSVDFLFTGVSYDYGTTVGWDIKEGRSLSKDFATDSSALIINETAARFMGLKKPLGEIINWNGTPFKVIGVIKDMIVTSPFNPVAPTVFFLSNDQGDAVIAKINPAMSAAEALKKIEAIFTRYNPAQPFEFQFVDEEYAKKFGNEERIGRLAGFFSSLAILISCLGLYGMASFMAEQRTKEIGVRKVLGASVFSLWGLLSKDFVVLVIIALFIATPLAYYFMHNWLQNYQYRATIAWWIFVAAGAGALFITLATISFQAIKAALMNPVRSLRSE